MFSFFKKLKEAVKKSASHFYSRLEKLFKGPLTEEAIEEFEQLLIEANFGSKLTLELIETLKKAAKTETDLMGVLKKSLIKELLVFHPSFSKPHVILIVGVNGSGKTTTVAKLAHYFKNEGKEVIVGAGDTFRAAALEQLTSWCNRLRIPLVSGKSRSDPSSVVFDASDEALRTQADLLIIDTAGRLESKTPLMQELEKLRKVLSKKIPAAPHETLLVIDATIGQNALEQARVFQQHTPLSGLIITKIDSNSRPGVVFAIQRELKIPILFLGTGEKEDDLLPFNPEEFVNSLLS